MRCKNIFAKDFFIEHRKFFGRWLLAEIVKETLAIKNKIPKGTKNYEFVPFWDSVEVFHKTFVCTNYCIVMFLEMD